MKVVVSLLLMMAIFSMATASYLSPDWDRKQRCWIVNEGVCVKRTEDCPFLSKVMLTGGCPAGYLCCEGPRKSIRTRPITTQKCGYRSGDKSSLRDRIIRGFKTTPDEYPWQALILCNGKFMCGGSIISDRWVITAAHCFDPYEGCPAGSNITVKTGLVDRDSEDKYVQHLGINKKEIHPKYNETKLGNDIALLKLKAPIRIDGFSRPICLPRREKEFTGLVCIASGWGKLQGGAATNTLRAAPLPTLSNTRCNIELAKYESEAIKDVISESNICAAVKGHSGGACNGDFGGPLACRMRPHQWLLSGIASWAPQGNGTCHQPTVFTRVTYFLKWIEDKTGLRWD